MTDKEEEMPKEVAIQEVDVLMKPSEATTSNDALNLSVVRKRKRQDDEKDGEEGEEGQDLRLKQSKVRKSMIDLDQTELTDLNVDCYEYIFEHLSFEDLVNVADANISTYASNGAYLVFSRRYSQYNFKLNGYETPQSIEIDDVNLGITINSAFNCAKVLRCFSGVIKKLVLMNFNKEQLDESWSEVQRLINEKCTKKLCALTVSKCKSAILDQIELPFENVDSLRVSCSDLSECIDINKWFPKLERLQLLHNDCCIRNRKLIPSSNHLTFYEKICLSMVDLMAIIKSAPTIETLTLNGILSSYQLREISKNLPNLKHFDLRDFEMFDEPKQTITFKNVETLSISTGQFQLGVLPIKIPFNVPGLTELRVITFASLGQQWIDFALSQTDLVKLKLESTNENEITDDHLAELAAALTKLQELYVFANVSIDGLAYFLVECKSLQKLEVNKHHFRLMDLKPMRKSIDAKWHIHRKSFGWTFERKLN